jgi:hypothetical protein
MGIAVGMIVQRAVTKLSDPTGSVLDPAQYRLPGTIGRLSSSIRAGGTGEVTYELGGVRQVMAARALGDKALPRGAEVIVLRADRGIAVVELFDAFAQLGEDSDAAGTPSRG